MADTPTSTVHTADEHIERELKGILLEGPGLKSLIIWVLYTKYIIFAMRRYDYEKN